MKAGTLQPHDAEDHLCRRENMWIAAARFRAALRPRVPCVPGAPPIQRTQPQPLSQSVIGELQPRRLLSIWMPMTARANPETNNVSSISQLCGLGSKNHIEEQKPLPGFRPLARPHQPFHPCVSSPTRQPQGAANLLMLPPSLSFFRYRGIYSFSNGTTFCANPSNRCSA